MTAIDQQARAEPVRRPDRRAVAVWGGRFGVIALIVGVWALLAAVIDLIPPIVDTGDTLASAFGEGWIWSPLWDTLKAALAGFVVAAAVGLFGGFVIGRTGLLRRVVEPMIAGLFAVPRIILYPTLLAIFGVGASAKLSMAALSAFFPIFMTTLAAVRNVNPTLVRVGRSVVCTRWGLARKIYLPATADSVLSGLRIGYSIAFVNVIIAEFFAATNGLGRTVSQAYGLQELPRMFAVIIVIFIMALGGNLVLWAVEFRVRGRVS
ncbi:MAG: ABC transporter permease [Streptosporangiaceae bacterium]